MTTLTKRVSRLCPRTTDRGREIVLTLLPGDLLTFRRKGTRTAYVVTIEAAYHLAAKCYAKAAQAEKLAARKARRGL